MFSSTVALFTVILASTVLAAPTNTLQERTTTVAATGVTHTVVAGFNSGLIFEPNNIVAQPGDIVEWHFLAKNHSIVQSSFAEPCKPLNAAKGEQGFFAGFSFVTNPGSQNSSVFQITVNDTNPIWFYCPQTTGSHCQKGMSGVINQNFNSGNTLAAYQAAGAKTNTSGVPATVEGGKILANPNPNAGVN